MDSHFSTKNASNRQTLTTNIALTLYYYYGRYATFWMNSQITGRSREIENITNLAALNPTAIVNHLRQARLVTTTQNRLDEVLKYNNNITEYVILVFDVYKHRDEERLTWSTTDTGKCLALLIRDMGVICPFNADGTNIHLGTACREWTPTATHRDSNSYFRNNLARQICPILVGQQRAIRDLRFVTTITVKKTQHRRTKRGRHNNSL